MDFKKYRKSLKDWKNYTEFLKRMITIIFAYAVILVQKGISFENKGSIILLILAVLITLYTFYDIIRSDTKAKERQLKHTQAGVLYDQSKVALNGQLAYTEKFFHAEDYFKLLLVHIRTKTEVEKFKKINNSHNGNWIISSLSRWDYFIYIFRCLITELGKGDEYLTLSIIDFWEKDKDTSVILKEQGIENGYNTDNLFEMNFYKSFYGNVRSKRIIIVNKTRLKKGMETGSDLGDKQYCDNFEIILNKFAERMGEANFENWFYLVDESDYKELTKEDVPFALVRRNEYSQKLCVSTFNPDIHEQVIETDSEDSWRRGDVPKIGMHIARDENDSTWKRLIKKFDNIYKDEARRGEYFSPDKLKQKFDNNKLF